MASFRRPFSARYQVTYWLPPKTTLVGFAGSALGIDYENMGRLYDELKVGVVLESYKGKGQDLWQYTKPKAGADTETAVALREFISQAVYHLYFEPVERYSLNQLKEALDDPVYGLRFGRSDDLARYIQRPCIVEVNSAVERPLLQWTVLPYGLSDQGLSFQVSNDQRVIPPRVSKMPVRFTLEHDRLRSPIIQTCTEVFDLGVIPDDPEGVWQHGERYFYLF